MEESSNVLRASHGGDTNVKINNLILKNKKVFKTDLECDNKSKVVLEFFPLTAADSFVRTDQHSAFPAQSQ